MESAIPGGCSIHPDRAAAVICARCGRFACSECIVPERGDDLCLECVERVRALGQIKGVLLVAILWQFAALAFEGLLTLVGLGMAASGAKFGGLISAAEMILGVLRLPVVLMLVTRDRGAAAWVKRHAFLGLAAHLGLFVAALTSWHEMTFFAFVLVFTSTVTASIWLPFFHYSPRARAAFSE